MNKETLKAALVRAMHTFWQTLAAVIPVGVVATPKMIKELDWSIMYIILAWLATALIAAAFSFIKSMAAGMPEVQLQQTLYDLDNRADEQYAEEYDALDDMEVDEEGSDE